MTGEIEASTGYTSGYQLHCQQFRAEPTLTVEVGLDLRHFSQFEPEKYFKIFDVKFFYHDSTFESMDQTFSPFSLVEPH